MKMSRIVGEEVVNVLNNVPPLPKAGEQRSYYSRQCLDDIAGNDYNSKRRKLPRNK